MAKQVCENCKKELNYSILRSDIVWVNGQAYCQECAEIIEKQELGEEDSRKEIERQRLEEKKFEEEKRKKEFVTSTTDTLQGYRIIKYFGVVSSSVSTSRLLDIWAYTVGVNETLMKQAISMGGNAIAGLNYFAKQEELMGFGTVVLVERTEQP